jgi:hypothetical protein
VGSPLNASATEIRRGDIPVVIADQIPSIVVIHWNECAENRIDAGTDKCCCSVSARFQLYSE